MSSLQEKLDIQVSNYGDYITELSKNEISTLKNTIFTMNNLGVSEYAERIIDMNGNSVKFCNSLKWYNLEKDNSFFSRYQEYVSNEVLQNFLSRSSIITRSKDKVDSIFLQELEKSGLNNSVIVQENNKDYITLSYFMLNPHTPSNRDIVLNNLSYLKALRDEFRPIFLKYFFDSRYSNFKRHLLSKDARRIIFKSCKEATARFLRNKSNQNFTKREVECLQYLKGGWRYKSISDKLGISISTIKFHINNIKIKTGLENKTDLIKFYSNFHNTGYHD